MRWLLAFTLFGLGCNGMSADVDSAVDSGVADTGTGGGACGATTCGQEQLCVHACQATCTASEGGVACPAPFCVTPPANCGAQPTCACLTASDPCNTDRTFLSLGVCSTITNRVLTCGGCD